MEQERRRLGANLICAALWPPTDQSHLGPTTTTLNQTPNLPVDPGLGYAWSEMFCGLAMLVIIYIWFTELPPAQIHLTHPRMPKIGTRNAKQHRLDCAPPSLNSQFERLWNPSSTHPAPRRLPEIIIIVIVAHTPARNAKRLSAPAQIHLTHPRMPKRGTRNAEREAAPSRNSQSRRLRNRSVIIIIKCDLICPAGVISNLIGLQIRVIRLDWGDLMAVTDASPLARVDAYMKVKVCPPPRRAAAAAATPQPVRERASRPALPSLRAHPHRSRGHHASASGRVPHGWQRTVLPPSLRTHAANPSERRCVFQASVSCAARSRLISSLPAGPSFPSPPLGASSKRVCPKVRGAESSRLISSILSSVPAGPSFPRTFLPHLSLDAAASRCIAAAPGLVRMYSRARALRSYAHKLILNSIFAFFAGRCALRFSFVPHNPARRASFRFSCRDRPSSRAFRVRANRSHPPSTHTADDRRSTRLVFRFVIATAPRFFAFPEYIQTARILPTHRLIRNAVDRLPARSMYAV
ncbi:hypothetical protein B0H10DRAFT_2221738 [Mycena sp. CBHHK59/15]|nr:hypothetical protein B0H10DRAFT_2221738 [Mycena sp. CBHHK59/15]